MLNSGAATARPDRGSPLGEPAAADRAGLLDRALPRGLGLATSVWVVAFVARLPQSSLDSRWLLALLLAVLAAGAMAIGWRTRSVAVATASLLIGGVVNCLLVSSVIHSGDTATQEVNRVTLSDWAWIPGSLAAAGAIGLCMGAIGKLLGAGRGSRPIETATRSQAILAVLAVITTLCLIAVGSLVTSLEVGLSVPDWPTSYGYNMFLFPFTKMVGGIYYEHAHRLVGTLVGMQVLTLCVWLWRRPPAASRSIALQAGRCPRCGYSIKSLSRRQCPECGGEWTRDDEQHGVGGRWIARLPRFAQQRPFGWLGTAVLILVIGQGLLGGFRVTFVNMFGDHAAIVLAVFHACTAQLFLLGAALLAFALRRTAAPRGGAAALATADAHRLAWRVGVFLVALALCQTLFGAVTRHFGLGWALRLHVLGALAVVGAALTLTSIILMHSPKRAMRAGGMLLIATVIVQVLLGAAAWWLTTRLDRLDQVLDFGVTLMVSSHVIVGALVLLESWVLTLALGGREGMDRPDARRAGKASPDDGPIPTPLQGGLA